MPSLRWFLQSITNTITATGYNHVIHTNAPCHLWLRWTIIPPQFHSKTALVRGLRLRDDVYFCFVAYHDIEQEEAGDTLIHTFIAEPWPVCQTRFFYFHGTINGVASPSTSAIFTLHRTQTPQEATFYSNKHPELTSVDGRAGRSFLTETWTQLRTGVGTYADDVSVGIICRIISSPWPDNKWATIERLLTLFDTSPLGPTATPIEATLTVFCQNKLDDLNMNPNYAVYACNPNTNTAVIPADYGTFNNVPLSNVITHANIVLGGLNVFTLNPAGLAEIKVSDITKLGIREHTHDAQGLEPPWTQNMQTRLQIASADDPTDPPPALWIKYTT